MRQLFFLLLLFTKFTVNSQDFLDQHAGSYKGYLFLCTPGKPVDSLGCEMVFTRMGKTERWTNYVTYDLVDGQKIVKGYELVKDSLQPDGQHYILDEKDGILITETRVGNTLFANYTVANQFYIVRTSFEGKWIDYELSVYAIDSKRESASEEDREGICWKVDSFGLVTVQKARLYKQ